MVAKNSWQQRLAIEFTLAHSLGMKIQHLFLFALPLLGTAGLSSSALAQDAAAAPAAKVRVTADHIEVLEPISFNSGKDAILASSNAVLDELATVVKAQAEKVAGIRIEGHTDNTGDAVFNAQLSDRRAKAVETALVKRGINADRIVARGFGPKHPIADNGTSQGRAQNRRVEIVILSKEQLSSAKDDSIGRVSALSGGLQVWVDGAFKSIYLGQKIDTGAKVRLSKNATADITLKDDTRLHLANEAILTLASPKNGAKYNADANLEAGSIWVTLSELSLGKMFTLNTPSAAGDFDIGEKFVELKDGITNFSNFGGRPLWVWPQGKSGRPAQVNTGKGASVAAGARPTLVSLPKAPAVAALSGSHVATNGISFASWPAIPGAKAIHVLFGAGADGLGALTEFVLPGDATSIDGGDVPGGWQWMSLQSENDTGFMSPLSKQQKVGVVKINSDTPFKAGETTQVAAGTRLSIAPPTLCKLDDGEFTAEIVLATVGRHSLFCQGPLASGFVPWSFDVAAIELVAVAPSANSPFKTDGRHDFELRSTAPLGKGLRFVVEGPTQYDGIRHIRGDIYHAWASFVPDTDAKLPTQVKVMRHGVVVAVAPVTGVK